MISKELELGRAAEYLVCADLILRGFPAMITAQGLPYDVIVEVGGELFKIQVKSTSKLIQYKKQRSGPIYRFGIRAGKGGKRKFDPKETDYFAFVALDSKIIAYLPISALYARTGNFKQVVDFKTKQIDYKRRVYSNGTIQQIQWGKYIEDYSEFPPEGGATRSA